MSRVATNYPNTHYHNGIGQPSTSRLSRSPSNSSTTTSIQQGGRMVTVRSAAPPLAQKETVHACPLCNGQYKDPRVLPCTHTYCLNCIREKLMNDNGVTCPKCQNQVHPFDESDLNALQRNSILSQEWTLIARPKPSPSTSRNPVVNSSITSTSMPKQQDRRKSSVAESNGHDSTRSHSGLASFMHAFNKSSGGSGGRNSRSSSVSSAQPVVSNLVKIYSEATTPNQQQTSQQKPRNDSVISTGKHGELTRIFEQATNRSQRPSVSTESIIKRPSQAYEEIAWEKIGHGTNVAAPPVSDQWQTATEHHHRPSQASERRVSDASSSDQQLNVDNLHDIVSSIQQHSRDKTSPSFPRGPIVDPQINSRPSSTSRSRYDSDSDDNPPTPVQQSLIYANVQPPPKQQQHSRQDSYADSIRSIASTSTSRQSPAPTMPNNYQPRLSVTPDQQRPDDRTHQRASSVASTSRRSSDRFPPPPPPNVEALDFGTDEARKTRSSTTTSTRSSLYVDANETNFLSTERFNLDTDIPAPLRTNHSSRTHSQISSRSSTPTNRLGSKSLERDTHVVPIPSSSMTTAASSRVDLLLTDQKRLEREIEEQMNRLKHDYDDIRKQIDRKESSVHEEVKNLTGRLDEGITEDYHRKQKVFASLAADTNSVGVELERLKSQSNTNNNKQQLWANLEKIELNLQNIRRTVEQQKELQNSLKFTEGRRSLATNTIGQITYNPLESHRRFNSPPSQLPTSSSVQPPQRSTNIAPYKYLKIDHLATLEPEAIAITDNNKKILLGICNKLFILDEHGATLKVIQLAPSIRGIAVSKKHRSQNIAYISHDETVSIIDIDNGTTIDCVKETDSTGQSGTFLPLGIDTDNVRGDVYVCDYRNSCVIKFDDKLEFIAQWRVYNQSDDHYNEARPKLISVHEQKFYMIVERSSRPYYKQGIAYTFSLHICDANSGGVIKIIDADLLGTQRIRWPCSVQAINNDKCYILDTMTSGKYFNGQWQKHWSRILEINQNDRQLVTELFQLDSEAETMAMTKQNMIIAANGDILFVDLAFLKHENNADHEYQNLP